MLQDVPKDELLTMNNKVVYEQAVRGQQPGLSIMQDKLGDNVENSWGMTQTNKEPEHQD
ncbi:MAG: hypothetical protein J3K34DRAFT_421827 [Monoraphidium minutum]|nr:MAG: hypothetical protein J3K34DRAFT_421827 [Monoraphidium minutum]